jgi:acetylornithine/succinyldiaminopimelate/putrescine aminotransferase
MTSPPAPPPNDLRLVRGANDILVDHEGREYIDLFSANGTTWLGHANPAVAEAVARQCATLAIAGGASTEPLHAAAAALESVAGGALRFAALYSTGMEAAEFAIRAVRCLTGRSTVLGFAGCMHGKSMATAFLGWPSAFHSEIPGIRRLAFIPERAEAAVLASVADALRGGGVAAVFLEPILASAGGHRPSPAFVRDLARLCREAGTLLVLDEIVTGLYRTGEAFYHHALQVEPDVLLVGKSLGNGFPVAAVMMAAGHRVTASMLPGSTYSGNPVAAAAASAALAEMERLPLRTMVEGIESAVRSTLDVEGVTLRGGGALWVLALPDPDAAAALVAGARGSGVLVTAVGRFVRLLPAATIVAGNLARACTILADEIARRNDRRHAGR